MARILWTCPFCDRDVTLGDEDIDNFSDILYIENSESVVKKLNGQFIVCPNPKCKKISLSINIYNLKSVNRTLINDKLTNAWQLIPESKAKPFPDYIPSQIISDYKEACLIVNLSPKASATLARRCLQGMIRNFWNIKKKTLYKEINAIKKKVDPLTWTAIDGVRNLGNIGAHMEKDINLVIDVDPDEAEKLINLIEILLKDWYINRKTREEDLQAVVKIADDKKQAKKAIAS